MLDPPTDPLAPPVYTDRSGRRIPLESLDRALADAGLSSCLICSNPDAPVLGIFEPNDAHRRQLAAENASPLVIPYRICVRCREMPGAGDQVEAELIGRAQAAFARNRLN
jgi:hypothetical protein